MTNSIAKYQEQYINTLTSGELVTLLYSEISKNLSKAVIEIGNGKTCEAHNKIIKAQDIILHLISTLDFNFTISDNLLSLYDYMYTNLIKANVAKDPELIGQINSMVVDLKNTWVQAEKISRVNAYAAMAQSV